MNVKTVGVVGCGLMGSGIAQVCAQTGYRTLVTETARQLLDRGIDRARQGIEKLAAKGKLSSEAARQALDGLQPTLDIGEFAACDLVIEAVVERMEIKKQVFSQLDGIVKKDAVLASNTSSLSITELGAMTGRSDRVIGLHFFNPVPLMPLVEIVRGLDTSDETYAWAREFCEGLGKQVITARDNPGFIVNYLLIPFMLDAVRAYEQGIGSREDIDAGMRLGCNHPMGPLTLIDFVGLDTTLFIADAMFDEYKSERFAAPPLLRRMVAAGHLGRKSGKGFYDHS